MKHLLLTTIAAVLLLATTAFADPIHTAAWDGDLAGVQAELDKGVDVNAKGYRERTPLHDAAYRGHKEIVELLIDAGADVNAKSERGRAPLRDAADNGHNEIVELLLTYGADVNAKDADGNTPLDKAIEEDHTEIIAYLREWGGRTNAEDLEYKLNAIIPLKEAVAQLQHLIIGDDGDDGSDQPSIEKLQGVFVIRGKVGGKYEVQYHTGDNNWQVREEITLTANRQLYIDSSSYDEKRFYRVKQLD